MTNLLIHFLISKPTANQKPPYKLVLGSLKKKLPVIRHEKSGVWFLQHIFHFSEGSSKLAGIFQKTQAGNVVFTTRTKAYFDNLCSGLMDSLN